MKKLQNIGYIKNRNIMKNVQAVELICKCFIYGIVGAVGPPSGTEKKIYMKTATHRMKTRFARRNTFATGFCLSDVISRRCSACSSAVFFSDSTSSDIPQKNCKTRFHNGNRSVKLTIKTKIIGYNLKKGETVDVNGIATDNYTLKRTICSKKDSDRILYLDCKIRHEIFRPNEQHSKELKSTANNNIIFKVMGMASNIIK